MCSIRCKDKTSGLLNRGGIADSLSWQHYNPKSQVILLPYASLAASKILLQWLIACLNFNLEFRFEKLMLLVQTKKIISMNYGSSTSGWKPWWSVRLDLIFTMKDYASIQNWIHSYNSLAETPILNIFLHETSSKWSCRQSHSAQR